jgi:hypothetical protein
MANARIVLAQGLINGSNKVFSTGVPYVPGSTAYILNGRIHNRAGIDSDYGFSETNPDAGEITVDIAPLTDDVVQIFFWDRLVQPAPPITQLTGVVQTSTSLTGVARDPEVTRLSGVVRSNALTGVARDATTDRLAGVVRSQRIIGTIKDRC